MGTDDDVATTPSAVPFTVPLAQAWLMRGFMQARHHVDDEVAMRELGPFLRAGGRVEQVGGWLTMAALITAILVAISLGGTIGTRVGILAGILAMMGATVVLGGGALVVVNAVQKVLWQRVIAGLDGRMDALGWNEPGTRQVNEEPEADA